MGTWGTGLYQDDLALDLKDKWKELAQFGFNPPDMVAYFLEQSPGYANPKDQDYPLFWLVVADLLMKRKCLDTETKQRVIDIIDSGQELKEWKEREATENDINKRRKVLEKLRVKFQASEYREPKPSKIYIEKSPLEIDDLCTYQHPSGYIVVLRVVGHFSKFGSHSPIFQILDWHEKRAPSPDEAQSLPLRDEIYLSHPNYHMSDRTHEPLVRKRYELLRKKGCIPADMSFETYFECQVHDYYPVIRAKVRSKAYQRVTKLGVKSPSPCYFVKADVATNAWVTWQQFDSKLTAFWQYEKMFFEKEGINCWAYGL